MRCFLVCLMLIAAGVNAQDKGEPISLHVKEVHRDQDESTEKGTWFHIKAVVESKTVVYSIKCDEFLNNEKGFLARCTHISAGKDYDARKFQAAISFWKPEDAGQGTLILYDIVSEKEK